MAKNLKKCAGAGTCAARKNAGAGKCAARKNAGAKTAPENEERVARIKMKLQDIFHLWTAMAESVEATNLTPLAKNPDHTLAWETLMAVMKEALAGSVCPRSFNGAAIDRIVNGFGPLPGNTHEVWKVNLGLPDSAFIAAEKKILAIDAKNAIDAADKKALKRFRDPDAIFETTLGDADRETFENYLDAFRRTMDILAHAAKALDTFAAARAFLMAAFRSHQMDRPLKDSPSDDPNEWDENLEEIREYLCTGATELGLACDYARFEAWEPYRMNELAACRASYGADWGKEGEATREHPSH